MIIILKLWHYGRALPRNENLSACLACLNLVVFAQIHFNIVTWLALELRAGFGEGEVMLGGREGYGKLMLLELAMLSNDWKVGTMILGGQSVQF